jgi:hypothetical protein
MLCNIASLFEEIEGAMVGSLLSHTKKIYCADLTPAAVAELKTAVGMDERKGLREASDRALIPHDQLIVRFSVAKISSDSSHPRLFVRREHSVLLQFDIWLRTPIRRSGSPNNRWDYSCAGLSAGWHANFAMSRWLESLMTALVGTYLDGASGKSKLVSSMLSVRTTTSMCAHALVFVADPAFGDGVQSKFAPLGKELKLEHTCAYNHLLSKSHNTNRQLITARFVRTA